MKKITNAILYVFLTTLAVGGIEAKSYIFGGAGLQFNLGNLGSTITTDGLESSNGPGTKSIVAEDKLKTAHATTAGTLLHVQNAESAMTGGVLTLGYEKELGEYFFARAAINYTEKIMGGHTVAKTGPYDWYNVTWNYKSWVIPVHLGVKLKVADKASIYVGGGMHYYNGGWGIKGRVDGASIASLGGQAKTMTDALGVSNTQIINEDVQFRVKGYGFNWIIGAAAPISERGSLFFEVETILSGQLGGAVTKSEGGKRAMAYEVYYPVVLGGTIYRVGYKREI